MDRIDSKNILKADMPFSAQLCVLCGKKIKAFNCGGTQRNMITDATNSVFCSSSGVLQLRYHGQKRLVCFYPAYPVYPCKWL
jgi:hypothetical protein